MKRHLFEVSPEESQTPAEPAPRPADGPPPQRSWRWLALIGVVVSAAGFVAFLMALYSGMRDVMVGNGGFCASGGPYAIAGGHNCTSGDIHLIFGGVMGMLVAGLAYAIFSGIAGGSVMGGSMLMWAALFGALGWNFIDTGRHGHGSIFTGVVFWLMAAGGLIIALVMALGYLRRGGPVEPPHFDPDSIVRAVKPGATPQQPTPSSHPSNPGVPKRITPPRKDNR